MVKRKKLNPNRNGKRKNGNQIPKFKVPNVQLVIDYHPKVEL